jgi:hypothetical protein
MKFRLREVVDIFKSFLKEMDSSVHSKWQYLKDYSWRCFCMKDHLK